MGTRRTWGLFEAAFAHEGCPQKPLTPRAGGISRSPLGASLRASPAAPMAPRSHPPAAAPRGPRPGSMARGRAVTSPAPLRSGTAPAPGPRAGSCSLRALRSHSSLSGPKAAVPCGSRQSSGTRGPRFPLRGLG